eukprot:TRINITY_DN21985_c0_g1_i1.p1 TRINITY_DN21985_c0_g1~~TRINITY_DN21985_c0_g1_i1.p1  ORF type:complete len:696 (-),score=178.10 TRINITY_DN21985_c0_g1_i1:11-2098(-)
MAGNKDDKKKDALKSFEDDSDAFFESLLEDAGVETKPKPKPVAAAPKVEAAAKPFQPPARAAAPEPEVQPAPSSALETQSSTSSAGSSDRAPPNLGETSPVAGATGRDAREATSVHTATQDSKPQEVPPAPDDFTEDDLALREALSKFYTKHGPEKLSNVNSIVPKYRGINVATLWAQLSIKYNMPVVESLELMSQTLYVSSPFEVASAKDRTKELEEAFAELRKPPPISSASSSEQDELLRRAIARSAEVGEDQLLRLLTFRGLPDSSPALRAQAWKVLLGYLPMRRHDEWNAIQGEKRALYAGYTSDMLSVSATHDVCVKEAETSTSAVMEAEDLLQEIKQDVERTRTNMEYFRRPDTQAALLALLFVYARLNPGVRYVQGMNEVAAVVLYVMSADPETAEADAFWCFSELMAELKDGFIQALDHSGDGVQGMAETVNALLKRYDPDLAKHLQRSELSLFVFILRWCTVLFAQEVALPGLLRLWDSFLADPCRFEFVVHVSVAVLMSRREELLRMDKTFDLAEAVQAAPRSADLQEILKRAFAICAFERRGDALPQFPPKRDKMVEDLSEWMEGAAQKAAVAASIANQASAVAAEKARLASAVAADKAQAVQAWIEGTAPSRQEAIEQAQTQLSSFWSSVRSKASEVSSSEAMGNAAAKWSSAKELGAGLFARASQKLGGNEPQPPQDSESKS